MINTERLCFGCMNDNGGEKICPICGYNSDSQNPEEALPVKFIVNNRYLVGKLLYVTGEAIVYIGWDGADSSIVEIKEYFPKRFAHRNPDKTVSMVKGGEYTFNQGLMEFAEINSSIMASELPSLVPVKSVFEENGTVYAINSHISGITLEQFLQKNGGSLKWEQARALFLPLIDTIKGMNEAGFIHRGISTENIMVGRDGKLRIRDYSIKNLRHADSELEYKLYSGYSPIELYGFDNISDGYHTDVYSLCATIFRVLIGTVPPEATLRINDDSMTVPSKFAEELPRHVLAALANGLQVLPENRTKNIEALKNELVYAEIAETVPAKKVREKVEPVKRAKKGATAKYAIISAVCTALVFAVIVGIIAFKLTGKEDSNQSSQDETTVNHPEIESVAQNNNDDMSAYYPIDDFKGKYYAEVKNNDEYEMFVFDVIDKVYSDSVPKGAIVSQSIAPTTEKKYKRDTKIEFVISLGAKEIKMPNLIGMTEDEAILELLKHGFMYEFINSDSEKEYEKYDEDSKPGVVLKQSPEYGTKVSTDIAVEFYVNSYTGEEETEETEDSSGETTDFQ